METTMNNIRSWKTRECTDDFLRGAVFAYFDGDELVMQRGLVNKFINTPSSDYTIDFLREMDDLLDDIYIAIDNDYDDLGEYDSYMKKLDDARDWIDYYRRELIRKNYNKQQFNVAYCMKKHGCLHCTAADEFCRVLHPISTRKI